MGSTIDFVANVAIGNHLLVVAAVAPLIVLLCWRLWRFTLTPILYPNDPRELPYWIPRHLRPFFNDSNDLISKTRLYFGDTREPFAFTIAGSTTYVITKSYDVAEEYRNTTSLSFNEFVIAMMRVAGNTETCIQAMFKRLPRNKEGFPNPHGKPLATLAREMHITQLYPRDNLQYLETQFTKWFDQHLDIDAIYDVCSPYLCYEDEVTENANNSVVLPLVQWCSDFLTRAGQTAYFGPELAEVDPTLPQTFLEWDELSYQVLYQYPHFLTGKMRAHKDKLYQSLKRYLQLPQNRRSGDAWFTKAMEDEMLALNISQDDIAIIFFTFTAFQADGTLDHKRLDAAQHNPCFGAIWNETIRMSAYASSVRFITQDTVLGGKLLRKGHRLMIPYRQLHFDESIFGPDVEEFRPARFGLGDDEKDSSVSQNLTRSDNWRPFSGGNTMCPGRYIAKRSIHIFIALLLRRFHIESVGPRTVPLAEMGRPVLGLMSTKKESEDIKVRLTPRRSST
ncbi:cytochrome P450 [Bisporella sp. PMI_857]|nr:cytochrome P450 [Bisporella sp. PMI_857]